MHTVCVYFLPKFKEGVQYYFCITVRRCVGDADLRHMLMHVCSPDTHIQDVGSSKLARLSIKMYNWL